MDIVTGPIRCSVTLHWIQGLEMNTHHSDRHRRLQDHKPLNNYFMGLNLVTSEGFQHVAREHVPVTCREIAFEVVPSGALTKIWENLCASTCKFSAQPLHSLPERLHLTMSRVRSPILEVERKFRCLAVKTLTRDGGFPPFRSLQSLPIKTIHDIYYDKADILYNAGTWVRRRNGLWEAKIRLGGDLTNSRFEELKGAQDIAACIQRITGNDMREDCDFGLTIMAEFTTTRETWVADEEFSIVRDRTDFGHEVGEVELQVEVDGLTKNEKKRVVGEMDDRIGQFMERYSWAFEEGKAVGKLTAYAKMIGRTTARG